MEGAEGFKDSLKELLGDKVSDIKVELIQNVKIGNHLEPNYFSDGKAFTAKLTIIKHDGTELKIDKPVISAPVDTL